MTNPVPILLYHSVSAAPPAWIAPYALTPPAFGEQLDAVVASGRQPLTVSAYLDGLTGAAALPPRPVLITFDDGFADFATAALPALAARGLPSTLYVTTGALADQPPGSVLPPAPMLRSTDLPGLEAAGVEIGAHSHTHRQLDLLRGREVAAELSRSRDVLTAALGHPVRSFSYPHSYWRRPMLPLVAAAGFDSACAVGNGLSSARDHPLALSRLMAESTTTATDVASWLDGSAARVLTRRRRVLAFGWRQYRRLSQRNTAIDRHLRPAASSAAAAARRQPGSPPSLREDHP